MFSLKNQILFLLVWYTIISPDVGFGQLVESHINFCLLLIDLENYWVRYIYINSRGMLPEEWGLHILNSSQIRVSEFSTFLISSINNGRIYCNLNLFWMIYVFWSWISPKISLKCVCICTYFPVLFLLSKSVWSCVSVIQI